MIVKQRKAQEEQDLDFLQKVDDEKYRGQKMAFTRYLFKD